MQTRWQRYPRKLITSARPSRQEARGRGASKSRARIRGDTTVEVLACHATVKRARGRNPVTLERELRVLVRAVRSGAKAKVILMYSARKALFLNFCVEFCCTVVFRRHGGGR